MRITNNMISYNFLSSLNKSLERQNAIQEQLSDGKAIHRPSDDPIKTARSLRFNTNLAQNDQYTQNAKDALSWMETTDGVMSDLSSIMATIQEKTIQAADGSNPQSAVQAIGKDIDELINHIVTLGNTKIGDRYIFSGQTDKTEPFVRTDDEINYLGDINKISMPIQAGTADPSRDGVNLTGYEVFGSGLSIINHLIEIKQHMASGTAADQQWLSETGLQYIDSDHSQVLQTQTELGSRMSMYQMAESMMENNSTTITGDISDNEDLDVPRAIIDFKTSESVYRAALSVGSNIMPVSLVDFLK